MAERDAVFPAGGRALYDKHLYSAAIRSGDLLFVSGQVGGRADGSPEPDFAKQVRLAFDRLEAVLQAAGCTFDDVVDVTTFHTDPKAQMEIVRSVRRGPFGSSPYPNWTAVGVSYLSGFDFEIKVVARIPGRVPPAADVSTSVASGAMPPPPPAEPPPSVIRRNPPTMWDMASAGFSQISVASPGRLAFLSGQVASDPGDGTFPRELAEQARMATASLGAALTELGASPRDIAMLRVYVVDATTDAFMEVLTALRAMLGSEMPSITTVGVQALFAPDIRVEIEMVVRVQ